MNEIRFIDLFAGIGGFRLGLEKVGIFQRQKKHYDLQQEGYSTNFDGCSSVRKKQKSQSVNSQNLDSRFICVWSNEWDKYARRIYEKHFGECDPRDIRAVEPSEIPDFDLLCAGFPCQSFSIAGKRGGFADTRGTLFFDICRILRAKRPSYCLLENVKGLLSHNEGQTFQVILESLAKLGYGYQWQVLNSKHFGVPQNRERVFIIGHLREKPRPEVFPVIESIGKILPQGNGKDITGTIETRNQSGQAQWDGSTTLIEMGFFNSDSQGQRVYSPEGISAQINSQGGGWGAKTGLYKITNQRKKNKDGNYLVSESDKSNTLGQRNNANNIEVDFKIRRLTPLECERLQGFPDGWTEGISDTQRYKCLGNAVTVNVIEWLGQNLSKEL